MRKILHRVAKHPLISGSTITIIGSLFANIVNYIANLVVARLLISADYGIFASLVSIFNIFSVFSLTMTTVFTKFTAVYVGQKREDLIGFLIRKGSIWVGILSLIISGVIIIFSNQIANFLNIKDTLLIVITSLALFFSLLSSVPMGILQGALKFLRLSSVNFFSSSFKVVFALILLLAGMRVFGAISAFAIASLVSYVFPFLFIQKYLKESRNSGVAVPNIYHKLSKYAFPVFLSSIGMTAIISVDIILVKHFFNAQIAGHYSALSLMGRSIFYAVQPITFVLFPLIAQKHERKEKLVGTVMLSFVIMGVPTIILNLIYFFSPGFILKIFFPAKEYLSLFPYLGLFSIFISLYVFSFLLNSFYISIGKVKVFYLTITASFIEVISLIIFHENLYQVIMGLIISSFLLLVSLLLYYKHATRSA